MSRINKIIDRINEGDVESTNIEVRPNGKQKFAIFGNLAFDISKIKYPGEMGCGYVPVKFRGKYYHKFNEYENKILVWTIFNSRIGKKISCPIWINTGYLYTNELEMDNEQISSIISDELDAGILSINRG